MARLSRVAAASAAVVLALLAGCGADGGTSVDAEGAQPTPTPTAPPATPTPSASPTVTGAGDPAAAEFCSAVTAADTAAASAPDAYAGSPPPEQAEAARTAFAAAYVPLLERVQQTAPEALAADVGTFVTLARQGAAGEADALAPDYARTDSAVDAYLLERCGYPEIPAYAVDYEFDRLPDAVPSGPTAISLTNDGQELHHIMVFRINDGVGETVDDLLALGPGDLAGKVRVVAVVTAKPGSTNTSLAVLEAGRYAAVCYVPVGSKRGAKGDGEPHHTEGMAAGFTVS